MNERRNKRRGPIGVLVDWFMVDPAITALVMAPVVVLVILAMARMIAQAIGS